MEDNLAEEIAKIEAELEADRQHREMQQQQQLQQEQQQSSSSSSFPFQGVTSAFGASAAVNTHNPPQYNNHISHNPQQGFTHPTQAINSQQLQLQQSSPVNSAGGSATSGQPHQFSKDSDGRSVFVGNLPRGENGGPTSTPEELAQFFAECGPILNCTLLRDRTTGELKGTAYVEFASYTGMGKAIDTKNNANFKGSTIIVC